MIHSFQIAVLNFAWTSGNSAEDRGEKGPIFHRVVIHDPEGKTQAISDPPSITN